MSRREVKCRCCGMMMVPKSVLSRGIPAGWGMYFGGGKPIASYCPFCLSEGWDGIKVAVEKTPSEKIALLIKIVFILLMVSSLLRVAIEMLNPERDSAFIYTIMEWALVIIGIAMYQRHKYKQQ